jgi:phosphatidylglycerol:prolipoprotein diacylglycerol transferase
MFPYIDTSGWHVGSLPVRPFGALLAVAIAAGYLMAARRAKTWGIPRARLDEMCLWMIAGGFLGGHLLRILYLPHPIDSILRNPLLLIEIFNGIASFGSFLGGLLGALAFLFRHKIRARESLEYFDAIGFGLPFGWMIGRIGCALIHDHPGLRTTSWLGVRFPGGARYDLGLLEALFLGCVAILFLALLRSRWAAGFFFGLFFAIYGPFRLWLDTLHVDPVRYFGWTVDQYSGMAALAGGALMLIFIYRGQSLRL